MFDRYLTLSADALFQEIGGEGVVLDLASASYFGLDEVGVRLWTLLQDNGNLRCAYETLLREFDVDPGRLEVDLQSLICELLEAGLMSERGALEEDQKMDRASEA
jgi:Coenzyme PQQ synthesis protein D (PqqD)